MFHWKRNREKKDPVFSIIESKKEYSVNGENLELFFEAVKKYPLSSDQVLSLRETYIDLYRNYYMLIESLEMINDQLKIQGKLLNNFNQGIYKEVIFYDSWLTDEKKRRFDYNDFIQSLSNLIETHLDILNTFQLSVNKVIFDSTVTGLYTIYHDCLNIAELHLKQVHPIH